MRLLQYVLGYLLCSFVVPATFHAQKRLAQDGGSKDTRVLS